MNKSTSSWLHAALCTTVVAVMFGLLGGCQSTPKDIQIAVDLYKAGNYHQSMLRLQPKAVEKSEDFVLNNCRLGSSAIAAGQLDVAENAFMEAYTIMNSVKVNDGGRKMASTLLMENFKVWKGEPFERAMAHYYLGILNLKKGDYENARAAFQNSLFKLRDYAEEEKADKKAEGDKYKEFESNFSLGYLGMGYCYIKTNEPDLAEAQFKRALELDPNLSGIIKRLKDKRTNAILFVDFGVGPEKAGKGWYNEESVYGPTPGEAGPVPQIQVGVNGKPATDPTMSYSTTDTYAMAQDKKWMDIDTIRKTKAAIGTGAMAVGTGVAAYGIQSGDSNVALAGLGIALVGAAISASSQADLRYWETLPRAVYMVPLSLPPGAHNVDIIVGIGTQTIKVDVAPQGDSIIYTRKLQ